MLENFRPYLLSFIPIFVAVDAIGNVPVFLSFVEHMKARQRRKVVIDSVLTATIVAICFMFVGRWVLKLLNVTISDFQIAGGRFYSLSRCACFCRGRRKTDFSPGLTRISAYSR